MNINQINIIKEKKNIIIVKLFILRFKVFFFLSFVLYNSFYLKIYEKILWWLNIKKIFIFILCISILIKNYKFLKNKKT